MFFALACFQILIAQCPDLAGPADQVGELDHFGIIPQDGKKPIKKDGRKMNRKS